jgi:hypothetical protein
MRNIFLITGVCLAVSGCGSSLPDCDSATAKQVIKDGISSEVIKRGVSLGKEEIASFIELNDVALKAKSDTPPKMSCSAVVGLKLPEKTVDKLTSMSGDDLNKRLEAKFDRRKAFEVFTAWTGSQAAMGMAAAMQGKDPMQAVSQGTRAALAGPEGRSAVVYEISFVKNSGKEEPQVQWQVKGDDPSVLYALALNLHLAVKD